MSGHNVEGFLVIYTYPIAKTVSLGQLVNKNPKLP